MASHSGMVQSTRLKVSYRGPLQWHDPSAEFHEDLQIGSKVNSGGTQTVRQRCDLYKPNFPFFKESRQKLIEFYENMGSIKATLSMFFFVFAATRC